ncbi:aconitase X swivel domain-containing protein [Pseudooceanicola sp. 200-1SW]|uniref:aconitase X swivel domain-containing protein n=1 Tax=Pseudooceanicola sp. 200-1SW TaxID=3425949 RepID=UPI003D7F8C9A
METLTTPLLIRGRCVVAGRAEGEALVTTQTISGWGGINERDGSIIERRHELVGQSFAGKILVFPGAKGSSGWSAFFHMTRINGVAPAAMLFTRMTTKMALGAVVTRVPSMTDFDHNVFDSIRTGDWVSVDAEAGEIRVTRQGGTPS